MQHGRNIFVYQNGSLIAGTRTNEIQTESETIEIANPDSPQWRKFMAGRKSWSISVGFLLANASDIRKVLNVGTTYTLVFRDRSNTSSVSGSAILKQAKITAQTGNLCQGSFSFQGTGALS